MVQAKENFFSVTSMYALPLVSILFLSQHHLFHNVSPTNCDMIGSIIASVRLERYYSPSDRHLVAGIDYIGCLSALELTNADIDILPDKLTSYADIDLLDDLHAANFNESLCMAVNQLLNRGAYRNTIMNRLRVTTPVIVIIDTRIAIDVIKKAKELSQARIHCNAVVVILRSLVAVCLPIALVVAANAKLAREMQEINETETDVDFSMTRRCYGVLRGHEKSLSRISRIRYRRN